MKKLSVLMGVLIAFVMTGCGWTTIGPGEAGIKFNKAGSDKGVDDVALVSGWVFSGPTTEVIVFPTTIQSVVWTADVNEGSPINQEITFQAKQGETFRADVSLSFKVPREKVPELYKEFRMTDLHVLADGFIRNRVRDALNRLSVEYTAAALAGPARPKLQDRVKTLLSKDLGEHGIAITELGFNGEFRYPDKIRDALEDATRQIQAAREAQEKVKQVEAEARQKIAKARGEAESKRLAAEGAAKAEVARARGDAEALRIRMEADREYNEMIQKTVSDRVLRHLQVKRWDGQYPRYLGGKNEGLMLNLGE